MLRPCVSARHTGFVWAATPAIPAPANLCIASHCQDSAIRFALVADDGPTRQVGITASGPMVPHRGSGTYKHVGVVRSKAAISRMRTRSASGMNRR